METTAHVKLVDAVLAKHPSAVEFGFAEKLAQMVADTYDPQKDCGASALRTNDGADAWNEAHAHMDPEEQPDQPALSRAEVRRRLRKQVNILPDAFIIDTDALEVTMFECVHSCEISKEKLARIKEIGWLLDHFSILLVVVVSRVEGESEPMAFYNVSAKRYNQPLALRPKSFERAMAQQVEALAHTDYQSDTRTVSITSHEQSQGETQHA